MDEKVAESHRRKMSAASASGLGELRPCVKIWMERNGEVVLSDWRMALMEAIDRTGSLAKAAEEMNVPYRSAWQKVRESEVRLGMPLVESQCGGVDGGNSRLTEEARDLLHRYHRFTDGLVASVNGRFREAFG